VPQRGSQTALKAYMKVHMIYMLYYLEEEGFMQEFLEILETNLKGISIDHILIDRANRLIEAVEIDLDKPLRKEDD
jgi:hypothetical protein